MSLRTTLLLLAPVASHAFNALPTSRTTMRLTMMASDNKVDAEVEVHDAAVAVNAFLNDDDDVNSLILPTIDLEVEPYHDIMGNLPLNTYKNKAPHTGTISSVKRIVGPTAPGEVCHININCGPTFRYWEGQSLGIIPPGENPKKPGKPNSVRLYSSKHGQDPGSSSPPDTVAPH